MLRPKMAADVTAVAERRIGNVPPWLRKAQTQPISVLEFKPGVAIVRVESEDVRRPRWDQVECLDAYINGSNFSARLTDSLNGYLLELYPGADPIERPANVPRVWDRPCFIVTLRKEWWEIQAARLTLDIPSNFPSGRVGLLVCPQCGGAGCGAVGPVISTYDNLVVWREFAHEVYYGERSLDVASQSFIRSPFKKWPPIVFDRTQYEAAISNVLSHDMASRALVSRST